MARRGHRRSSGSYRGGNSGWERAREHIREAEEFTREVGGTDKDVKEYFFKLSPVELRSVLDAYGREHGPDAREYAEKTIQKWRSGRVTMSGQTAKRLFSLLPPRMPTQSRLNLVRSLWLHYRTRRTRYLTFGPTANASELESAVKAHLDEYARGHEIPAPFKARFQWLSAGDSHVYEQMLNYYLELERQLAAKAASGAARVLTDFFATSQHTQHVRHFERGIAVDGYELTLIFDPQATGLNFSAHRPQHPSAPTRSVRAAAATNTVSKEGDAAGCAVAVVVGIIIGVLFLMVNLR